MSSPTDTARKIPADGLHRGRRTEAIVVAVAFLLINLATAATQKPYPFHDREGWEGAIYLEMARQVADGHFPVTDDAPMVFRLGTPAIVGWLHRYAGLDLLVGFRLVNGTANVLSVVLLVVWLRRFLSDWRVRAALVLAFLLQWDAPVRWLYFFPPHTDPWMWVFLLAGLIAVDRCGERPTARQIALVAAVTFVGVWFREIVLSVAFVLPFTSNPLRRGDLRARFRELPPRLVPLGAGLLAMAAVRLCARSGNDFSFAWTAVFYIFKKSWPVCLLSWFLAFGPILWLAIFRARRGTAFLMGRQHLLVFLAAFTVLADMGGSDTERFLYWTMPVVYVLIGRALENVRDPWPGWLLTIFAGAQLIASRAVFWPAIPLFPSTDRHVWPLFTPFARLIPLDDLYTDTAPRYLIVLALLEYLAFGAAVGLWLFWQLLRKGAFADRSGDRLVEDAGLQEKAG